MLHGDGEPILFEYCDEHSKFCYAVMKSDISKCILFKGLLNSETYYDLETPYGYGGPLSDGPIADSSKAGFLKEVKDYCKGENIVSQFVRFHPLLDNASAFEGITENRYMRDTIYIETVSPDVIMSNMDSKNRNMVRKAMKNGVTVVKKPIEEFGDFISMYNETMEKDGADAYYTFDEEYFKAQSLLSENASIYYAIKDSKPIAGAIMYYNERFMHYHLAGTHTEFRAFAPSNLLLYEAACDAASMGIKAFHLGGGMAPDDSLFGFKKQFNKNGRLPFVIGRTIFDKEKYDFLLNVRAENNSDFHRNNNRMIEYRA